MPSSFANSVSLLGRILLCVIFLLSGFSKIANWHATAAMMASHGLPVIPLLLTLSIIVEIAGGLALLFGWQTRGAALILFLYLIPVTLTMHNFWAFHGMEQQNQMFHFLKNIAVMGGLLEFGAVGAGLFSLDHALSSNGAAAMPFWQKPARSL